MSYVHCAGCHAAIDSFRSTRCGRCGQFLGSAATIDDQAIECVDRLGALLAKATMDERSRLAATIAAIPPSTDVAQTRWTNALSASVSATLTADVMATGSASARANASAANSTPQSDPHAKLWDDADAYRTLMLGFWLGVITVLRRIEEGPRELRRRAARVTRNVWMALKDDQHVS